MEGDLTAFFRGSKVAVTGAVGTIGRALVCSLLDHGVSRVFALDNDEGGLFFLAETYREEPRLECFLCDVNELESLSFFLHGIDYVFHVAAFKNVPVCERSPSLAVQTNIIGTQNVIAACRQNTVKRVIFTSSDKAVNPTNVMGTTKLMAERLITAANALNAADGTIFASTRFGNVAGSRGSVLPLFAQQIANGGPVTLTDKRMTRFIMSLGEAATLVLKSMTLARGGEAFVTKMPVFRIADLAQVMVEEMTRRNGAKKKDIKIVEVGRRVGEKFFEELVTDEEVERTYEIQNMLVVLPAFRNIYDQIDFSSHIESGAKLEKAYRSDLETPASLKEAKAFVRSLDGLSDWSGP